MDVFLVWFTVTREVWSPFIRRRRFSFYVSTTYTSPEHPSPTFGPTYYIRVLSTSIYFIVPLTRTLHKNPVGWKDWSLVLPDWSVDKEWRQRVACKEHSISFVPQETRKCAYVAQPWWTLGRWCVQCRCQHLRHTRSRTATLLLSRILQFKTSFALVWRHLLDDERSLQRACWKPRISCTSTTGKRERVLI